MDFKVSLTSLCCRENAHPQANNVYI